METIKEKSDRLKRERYSDGYAKGAEAKRAFDSGEVHSVVWVRSPGDSVDREQGFADGVHGRPHKYNGEGV